MSLAIEFAEAVDKGSLKRAKALLAKGANPNTKPAGWTGPPIVLAVNAGHVAMVKWLLGLGVKKPKDLLGWVTYATRNTGKFHWLFHQLIAEGAKVNHADFQGVSAVFYPSDPKLLAILLEKGAKLDQRDDEGATPLHWAARYGASPEFFDMLLAHGAKLDAKDRRGKTPLHYAKAVGPYNRNTVKYLEAKAKKKP